MNGSWIYTQLSSYLRNKIGYSIWWKYFYEGEKRTGRDESQLESVHLNSCTFLCWMLYIC
jgi:hypothetical protein